MENRIIGKFVVDNRELKEVESQSDLNAIIMGSLGAHAATQSIQGRIVKLTLSIESTTDKPWVACQLTPGYSADPCGRLLPPGTECPNDHYHRPAWVEPADGEPYCATCRELQIEPSRPFEAAGRYTYNHRNTAKED